MRLSYNYWKTKIQNIYDTRALEEANNRSSSRNIDSSKHITKVTPSPRKDEIPSRKSSNKQINNDNMINIKNVNEGNQYTAINKNQDTSMLGPPEARSNRRRKSSMHLDPLAFDFSSDTKHDINLLTFLRDNIKATVHKMYGRATPEE